jgi:hypothetical protein
VKRLPAAAAAALCAVAVLAGCGSGSSPQPGAAVAPPLVAPLNSSLVAGGRPFLVVAMGHLGQPDNTFYQVVTRTSKGTWSVVTPPGVADNGGLVAASAGRSAVIGFLASQLLGFSPLAASTDGGASWPAVGTLSEPLADLPGALAGSPSGSLLALVAGVAGGPASVEVSAGGMSSWHQLATLGSLQAAAGAGAGGCGVVGLTAVSFAPAGSPLVGVSCRHPGRVGILSQSGAGWSSTGPVLTGDLAAATSQVLSLGRAGRSVYALVAGDLGRPGNVLFVASSATPTVARSWTLSPALAVPTGATLLALGTGAGGDAFVLLGAAGVVRLYVERPGAGWQELPDPPAGAADAFFPAGGPAVCFTVHDSTLDVYDLDAASRAWTRTQSIVVPIDYGSSS